MDPPYITRKSASSNFQLLPVYSVLDVGSDVTLSRHGHPLIFLLPLNGPKGAGQNHNTKIANRSFENVEKFKSFRLTPTNQNCIHEEIKGRLNMGNACCHSIQNLIFLPTF
jgi:hypothetical protein